MQHRIVGRGERQLVDHHHAQRLAGHVHALPETGRAQQHAVAGLAEVLQQLVARRGALHEQRPRHAVGQQLGRALQRAMRGEQQERAALGGFQHRQHRIDDALGVVRPRAAAASPPAGSTAPGARSRTDCPAPVRPDRPGPAGAQKWLKSPATDSVAEVWIQAARVASRRPLSGVARSSGVACRANPRALVSYQRTSPSASRSSMRASRADSVSARSCTLASPRERSAWPASASARSSSVWRRARTAAFGLRVVQRPLRQRAARGQALHRQAQLAHGRVQRLARLQQHAGGAGDGAGLGQRIARQLGQLARADTECEKNCPASSGSWCASSRMKASAPGRISPKPSCLSARSASSR